MALHLVTALDDQIRETVNRLLDSLRSRLESDLGSCQDELVRAAQDASTRIAADAAERATAEARGEAEVQLDDLRRRLDEARQDVERSAEENQRRMDEGQREIETLRNDLEAARRELDETRDDVEATLRDIEVSRRDSDAAQLEVSRLADALRNKEEYAAQARRLPEAVRTLDEAGTFGEVLERLARSAGQEAGRAVVFLVKGSRLRDWQTVGFDLASDEARLDIELGDSGPIAEAVRTGKGVYPRDDSAVPDFARSDAARYAAAWPVSVGGSVVAVLYADSPAADTSDELYWPAFLDVLARHAGRVLEGITVRQAAGLMTGKAAGMSSSSIGHQSSGSIQ
jgi:hypothetical protein